MEDQYKITLERVRHVAKLAALQLDASEEKRFTEDLSRIVNSMQELSLLNTDGLEATFQTIPLLNCMRPDEEAPSLPSSFILQNAPLKEEGFFKIPPILE